MHMKRTNPSEADSQKGVQTHIQVVSRHATGWHSADKHARRFACWRAHAVASV